MSNHKPIIPHDFQNEAVDSIFNYFENNAGNPLVVMPTGTGKSVVIATFLKKAFQMYGNQKIQVLTHVQELISQNHKRFKQVWPQAPAGINSSGLKQRDIHFPIIFGGIKSVAKHWEKFGRVDLIIVDEAHLVSEKESAVYRQYIDNLLSVNPYLKVIGLTATPWRQGVGCLTNGGIFTDICIDMTTPAHFQRFIAEGFLSPLIPKRMHNYLDVTGVHMLGGEFNLKELQLKVDKEEITYAALKETLEFGSDRKRWLIFCSGVDHSIHVSEILNSMGIACEAVHSKLSNSERKKILDDYENGLLRAVTNNNVLTTGFDSPAIDLLVILRPSQSVILWGQMLGRGDRAYYEGDYDLTTLDGRFAAIKQGGKENCLVLDFAGNTQRLGPIDMPRAPRKKGEKSGPSPVKACPGCSIYIHISATECPYCGNQFTFQTKLEPTSSNEELISTDLPIIEELKVDHIVYSQNFGKGKPDSLKVTYYCGSENFSEYICLAHEEGSFARRKASQWWRKRTEIHLPPKDIETALGLASSLSIATHIRVWTNKKFPEIMNHCFDGSFFGRNKPNFHEKPDVKTTDFSFNSYTAKKNKPVENQKLMDEKEIENIDWEDFDDDIPF